MISHIHLLVDLCLEKRLDDIHLLTNLKIIGLCYPRCPMGVPDHLGAPGHHIIDVGSKPPASTVEFHIFCKTKHCTHIYGSLKLFNGCIFMDVLKHSLTANLVSFQVDSRHV